MAQQDIQSLLHDITDAKKWFLPDWNTRITAARQLGQLQASEAIAPLYEVVLRNENAELARAALQALGQIGASDALKAVRAVLDKQELVSLQHTAVTVLEQAIGSLGSRQDEAAAETLLTLWPELPTSLYPAVEKALRQLGPERVGSRLNAALTSLGRISDPAQETIRSLLVAAGAEIVDPLITMLEQDEPRTQREILEILSQIGEPAADGLIKAAVDGSPQVQEHAVRLLVKLRTAALPALLASFQGGDEQTQRTVGQILVSIGEPAVAPLLPLLNQQEGEALQTQAGDLLVRIGAPAVRPLLESAAVNPVAAQLLTQMKPAVHQVAAASSLTLSQLETLLHMPLPELQTAAMTGLAKQGTDGMAVLLQILAEGDEAQTKLAKDSLRHLGEPAVPPLVQLLAHENDKVRRDVGELLLEIGGPYVQVAAPALQHWKDADVPPRMATVPPDGEGGNGPLADAILQSTESSILYLLPGTHSLKQSLLLNHPVTLIGSGMDQTHIVFKRNDYAIRVENSDFFNACDMTFDYKGDEPTNLVEITQSGYWIYRCRFQDAVQEKVDEAESHTCEYGTGLVLALCFSEGISSTVLECEFTGNQTQGVKVTSGAKPTLSKNRFVNNGACGIACWGGYGTAAMNHCSGQKWGIYVVLGELTLVENICNENSVSGIAFYGLSTGIVRDNVCAHNKEVGIGVSDQAWPDLIHNKCTGSLSGIYYAHHAYGMAHLNECSGNEHNGIFTRDFATPHLKENLCRDNGKHGILLAGDSEPTLTNNTCQRNSFGITVAENAAPELTGNKCHHNTEAGIYATHNSQPKIRANDCSHNDSNGVLISGDAKATLNGNSCTANRQVGIAFFDSAGGGAEQNDCRQNGIGIVVAEQAAPTITKNRCEQNKYEGMTFQDFSAGAAHQNQCLGNETNGIGVRGHASPSLVGNVCDGNVYHGIRVGEQAKPSLRDNWCRHNNGAGIYYLHAAGGTATGNHCSGNQTGIWVQDNAQPRLANNDCLNNVHPS